MTTSYGPYSPVRQVGSLYFVSGQVGVDPDTKIARESIAAQTEQALKNLQTVLSTVGLGLNHVVKTTIFLTDIGNFAAMNEVYEKYFDVPRPARSAIAVRELPRVAGEVHLAIEIEAVASKEAA